MSKLKEIKERAEVNAVLGKTASQDEAKDTLKLIAAVEAVEALRVEWLAELDGPDDYVRLEHVIDAVETAVSEALA